MDFFQTALTSHRSTVLHGSFGRYPHLVRFYLEAIPELESRSETTHPFDDEWVFSYRGRFLYVLFEPPFHALLPSHRWCLVLTSHGRLQCHPLSTRFVQTDPPLLKAVPLPQQTPARDHRPIVPPTRHVHRLHLGTDDTRPWHVDLSHVNDAHEAYLRLLTLCDALQPHSQWSLSLPDKWRRALWKVIPGTGRYDGFLLRVLGK